MDDCLFRDRVVCIVARVIPVVDKRAEHGSAQPPVVWIRQVAWCITNFVSGIPVPHTCCYDFGRAPDGVWYY